MKICFYHRVDFDGVCSGAIVQKFYPDVKLIGINYGDEFPWEEIGGNDIIMVDFCLEPENEMFRLAELAKSLIWIDHHKSAIEAMKTYKINNKWMPFIKGIQRIGDAACELTWEYFYGTPIPIGVRLIGRYDVWDLKNHESIIPFQYGLRSLPDVYNPDNDIWKMMFMFPQLGEFAWIINNGNTILNYTKSWNKYLMDNFSFEGRFLGYDALFINMPAISTATFESRYDDTKYDLMVGFFRLPKGVWQVSLRTTTDLDVGKIARSFGGGGHAQASGFHTEDLFFLEEL